MTRQSRYAAFDSLGFMQAVQHTLFHPAFKYLNELLAGIQQENAKLSQTTIGFTYRGANYPSRPGVKFHQLRELHESLHERMDDYVEVHSITEAECHEVMMWYRNMTARCKTLADVKACLTEEVISVLSSDQVYPDIVTVDKSPIQLYPEAPAVQNLQLKYIGYRFIFS